LESVGLERRTRDISTPSVDEYLHHINNTSEVRFELRYAPGNARDDNPRITSTWGTMTEKDAFQAQVKQPVVRRYYRRSGVIVARRGGAFEADGDGLGLTVVRVDDFDRRERSMVALSLTG
jgi:phage repressor protein C with HTH and peptisase S24 domain